VTDLGIEGEALALFEALLDVPEAERDAWIAARTAGRPDLAARLAAICAADRTFRLRTGGAIDDLQEKEELPDQIGAYRIVARIGRGGMGAVYMGERTTGDFAHVAAIKLIKPGLLSQALVERFQRERQLLARLRHPHIAQLYDGGETPDGSPYIVLEYVDGLPLLDWIEANDPDRAQRLRLFAAICDAVAFANRNLVIHRDLTPSNILVTREGVVKLIDFGIARPLEPLPAPDVHPVADGAGSLAGLSLTPGYAAPERMRGAEVTTASDVYSLGRLLAHMIAAAEQDREFAAIVAKATANDPAARYATADALAKDVEAWRTHFPVEAMPRTRRYLLRKFVSRHPIGVGLASLALLLLVGAFAVTVQAYGRAETARQAEAARFAELRGLARYMLFDLNARLERTAGNTAARSDLSLRAQTYLSALAASRGDDPDLALEAARGFLQLARIQGLPTEPNLGQRDQAKANLEQAEKLLAPLAWGAPAVAVAVAQARANLYRAMIALHGDGDQAVAQAKLRQAFARLDAVPSAARDREWRTVRAEAQRDRVETLLLSGALDALPAQADRIAAEVEAWPADERASPAAAFDLAYADYVRGLALNNMGSPARALPLLRRAEERLERLDAEAPDDPVVLNLLAWTAYEGYGAGTEADPAEARRFLDLARRTVDRLTALESADQSLRGFALNIRQAQAEMKGADGHHRAAIALQREVVAGRRTAAAAKPSPATFGRIAVAEFILGNIALQSGDRQLACDSYRAAAETFADAVRRGPLLGRDKGFSASVGANVRACAAGAAPRPVA
jgi:serine/threonine-protein kinase